MAKSGQSWNNVLSYIKLGLGAPLNLLEISDSDLIEMLKEHVLPVFSQYVPFKKWVYVDESNRINTDSIPGQPLYQYKIPLKDDEEIVDILEVLFGPQSVLTQEYGLIPFNTMGAIDQVIANSYCDAIRSISVRNTWELIKPNTLILDLSIDEWSMAGDNFCIVNYTTYHNDLSTIGSDHYNLCLKKMCLGQTMIWLAAMRSKYESVSTPFGQLNLNFQQLEQNGRELLEQANQYLMSIPTDKLIEVF